MGCDKPNLCRNCAPLFAFPSVFRHLAPFSVSRFLSVILLFFCLVPHLEGSPGAAATGLFWQQRSQPTEFQNFTSICTDGNLFVAAGYAPSGYSNSFLSTSENGKSWTIVEQTANTPLTAVTYGNGRFVASGWYGAIYTSICGKNWTRVTTPTAQSLNSVAWLGSRFVACGMEGTLIGSVDGTTWNTIPSGTTSRLDNVCSAGSVALVLGSGGTLIRSNDGGVTWAGVNSGFTDDFTCAASTPLGIVIWSGNRRFLWDGASGWQWKYYSQISYPGQQLYSSVRQVRYNGTYWLAITSDEEMAVSTTGDQWYTIGNSGSDAVPYESGWLVVGKNGKVSQTTPGVSWGNVTQYLSHVEPLQSVIWHGDRYRAFGTAGTEYTSSDGENWQNISSNGLPWLRRAAAVRDGQIVIVGAGGWISVEDPPAGSNINLGNGVDLFGVAASPSAFVAVGKNGRIFRSPDGAAWTEVTSGTTELLTSVIWDGVRFHAVGSSGVYLNSANGLQWQKQITPGAHYLRAIAATSHGLLAVGNTGSILTSANGTSWSERSLATTQDFHTVVETDGGILALGKNGVTAWSADSVTWTLPPITGDGTMDFTSAVFHNGNLVAVSSRGVDFESGASNNSWGKILKSRCPYSFQLLLDPKPLLNTVTHRVDRTIAAGHAGTIWSSPDGETWDRRTHFTNWSFSDSLTVGNLTLLVGSGGVLASNDGKNWSFGKFAISSSFYPGGFDSALTSLTYGNGNWVACGIYGKIVVSNDGLNWHSPANSSAAAGQVNLSTIEWGGGRFVAIGSEGKLVTSADAENWSAVTLPTNDGLNNLIWTGTEFRVSTNSGSTLLVSDNGLSWSSRPAAPPVVLSKLVTANGRTFSLAGSEIIESSTDGNSWTRHSTYAGNTASSAVKTRQARDLLWTGSKYVAVGDEGFIMTSEDSYQWTYRNGSLISDLTSVNYVRDRFIATGSFGGLFSSPDGTTWTKHFTTNKPSSLNGLTWNSQIAVAVGNDVVLHSTDLWTWSETAAPSNAGLDSVAWAGDRFIVAGRNYKGGTSPDGISWTFQTVPMNTASSIAWSGIRAVAGHHASTDGLTWTRINDPWADGTSVIWDGQKFVVNSGTFIGISENGLTGYRIFDSPLYIRNVIKTPDGYFGTKAGVNQSWICHSVDGINWAVTEAKLPHEIKGLAWSGRQLMAVGTEGEIYSSSATDSLPFFTQLTAEGYSPEKDLTMQGDLNQDNVSNAIAYYFGMGLETTFSAADRNRLPQLRQNSSGGYELVFKLGTGKTPSFLGLTIEHSSVLNSWQQVARRLPDGTWNNPNASEQIVDGYRVVVLAVGAAENTSFWRLKVADVP